MVAAREDKALTLTRSPYSCGMVALAETGGHPDAFCEAIAGEAKAMGGAFAFIFHSPRLFPARELAASLRRLAPGVAHACCTTAGEITPDGLQDGQAIAMLLPARHFAVVTTVIEDVTNAGMESITARVEMARHALQQAGKPKDAHTFAVCLIDGMCYAEEAVTSAIHWGLDDIPLIGGSAGDDLNFQETTIIHEGRVHKRAAVIALVATDVPFHIFKTDNFVPTQKKLVVTASDPDHRIVHELNAAPAASEYAQAIGMDPESLSPLSFATHPVVVRVGGEYYCRSIQKVNEDGSLSFFCAIDDGVVLTVAEPTGMVETTRQALSDVARQLDGIDVVLGFECTHRRLDAQNRQIIRDVSELYRSNNVIGFATYGEQFRSMHLNQTFTGVAFGSLREAAE
ncbi:FIST N-terminal domain-containing protein [Zhengella sp. ZM62]|uniref:FIST N-terminal domain-containing protein n=1 Tax=Zhengella sedimenti TaxID=3390035 RepID=UPI0039747602